MQGKEDILQAQHGADSRVRRPSLLPVTMPHSKKSLATLPLRHPQAVAASSTRAYLVIKLHASYKVVFVFRWETGK